MVTKGEIAYFMTRSRMNVMGDWPRRDLIDWIGFMADQRALAIVVEHGELVAVGAGVRCHVPDMDDPWTRWDDSGPAFYVHQLVARRPEGLLAVLALAAMRIPNLSELNLYGVRHGRRIRLPLHFTNRVVQCQRKFRKQEI